MKDTDSSRQSAKGEVEQPRPTSWRTCLPPILVVIAGLVVYVNSLNCAFVFDDAPHILHNQRIRQLWPPGELLSGRRPVVDLSLAINYAVGDLRVWGYHAVNVAVHLLAALTLYGIVRRTLLREPLRDRFAPASAWLACIIALIWVVHPLQTQSVTYVIQRGESLMGLFYLLTLYCVIRGADCSRSAAWYAAAVVFCALGMGSKAVMITAPVAVFLYDWLLISRSIRRSIRRRWGLYIGLAATWGMLLVTGIAVGVLNPSARAAHVGFGYKGITPIEYLVTQFGVLVHYLELSFWPHSLCLDYNWPVARTLEDIVPPAIVIVILLTATLWAVFRKSTFGVLGVWFFIILLPTSSIVPIKDTLFEHRMYLPLAAVVVFVVIPAYLAFDRACERFMLRASTQHSPMRLRAFGKTSRGLEPARSHERRVSCTLVAATLVITVVSALGFATVQRNKVYESAVTMWRDVTHKRPSNARAFENLGTALMVEGKMQEAIVPYNEAVRLDPDYTSAHANLANVLSQTGEFEQALPHYRDVIRLDPNHVDAYINMAHALDVLGRTDEAIEVLRTATRIDPSKTTARELARVHSNLGSTLGNRGDLDGAIAEFREAVRLWPEYDNAQFWWGMALHRKGNLDEAIQHYREALRINPNHAAARQALQQALSERQP